MDTATGVYSCDDHLDLRAVPPDLWQSRLDRAQSERGPHVVARDDELVWVCEDRVLGGSGLTGKGAVAKKLSAIGRAGIDDDGYRAGTPKLRLEDMDRDGLVASVIYGPVALGFPIQDPELQVACYAAWNDWAVEEFNAVAPDRLCVLAFLPGHSPEAAAAELERCAGIGHRGAVIDVFDIDVGDPAWDRLWAAAAATGLPISFHLKGGSWSGLSYRMGKWQSAAFATVLPLQLDEPLATMVFSGALERHPGLTLVLAESGIGWLPYFLTRMDLEWRNLRDKLDYAPRSAPSELFRNQVMATFEEEDLGPQLIPLLGADSCMWASDYPHTDSTFPNSLHAIEESLGTLPEADRRKITATNCARLYGFAVWILMPAELVIRGGTVFDGSGVPGRDADVAIAGGVIREIGPNLQGARELDASGCAVAPGFIDIHTHYDAQVFWDPALRPSSYHGVTTVVAGNCGFTIAPTRPEHHGVIVHTLENVEDMDPATLIAGITWDFETFPQYLESVRRRGTVLNFTAYIGHSALRLYVMGDAAYERAATAGEIERMCRLVREALDAGAAGFSTSFSFAHRGVDGKPVPSRFSESDEVEALFRAIGEAGKGVVLITPGPQCNYADVYEWAPRVGRPFTYPLFAAPGGRHLEPVGLHEQGLADGAQVWPQVTPRPLTMQFTLADPYSLNTGAVFGELMEHDRDTRVAAYRDPAWRARAAADLENSPMKPRWETFEVSESRRFPELQGRRVEDLARERECSPLDVMCELSVSEDLTTRFRAYIANDDVDAVAALLTHDHVALGLSDAGAHVAQLCDAPLPTDLLGAWVHERGVMPLERAVRKLSGEPADMFGFMRRGYLREGNHADVCVFDPQTVGTGPIRRVRDFPANGERLTAEEPAGVRHVLVNGTPIRTDGVQIESLQALPGTQPEIA